MGEAIAMNHPLGEGDRRRRAVVAGLPAGRERPRR